MELSNEYIRGLIEGEGCFTFYRNKRKLANGSIITYSIPGFALAMHERDEDLINAVKESLGLRNKVYNQQGSLADGYNRGRRSVLMVREFGQLKNIIIPFFYNRLSGNKGRQFFAWLDKIGSDSNVPKSFKLLHRLHISGFYSRNPKYLD